MAKRWFGSTLSVRACMRMLMCLCDWRPYFWAPEEAIPLFKELCKSSRCVCVCALGCILMCSKDFQFSIMCGFSSHSHTPSTSDSLYSFYDFHSLCISCAYASTHLCVRVFLLSACAYASVLALAMTTSNVIRIMLGPLTVDYFPFSSASFQKSVNKRIFTHTELILFLTLSLTHAFNLLCLGFLLWDG